MKKTKKPSISTHGAYAQVHSESSEYGDGANINYNLGNDDYVRGHADYDRNFVADAWSSGTGPDPILLGQVAQGNDLEEEIEEELTDDELIDEALRETFPASDPPGYISKSKVDKELHSSRDG